MRYIYIHTHTIYIKAHEDLPTTQQACISTGTAPRPSLAVSVSKSRMQLQYIYSKKRKKKHICRIYKFSYNKKREKCGIR